MKIDLHASFKEISRYLSTPQQTGEVNTAGKGFANLLSSLNPSLDQTTEITEIIKEAADSAPVPGNFEKGPMASIRLPDPELSAPTINRMSVPEEVISEVTEPSNSVKSPSILSVRRTDDTQVTLESMSEKRRPERMADVSKLLDTVATEHGIDPYLGMAVVNAESSFNPNAVSADGHFSKGLFQLLDSTAKTVIDRENMSIEDYTPFEPKQNTEIGVRYLRHLHDLFSKETGLSDKLSTYPAANSASLEKLAVAAFNAGEGRVASAQDRASRAGLDPREFDSVSSYLPKTTQEYVERVMSFRDSLESEDIG